MLVDTTAVTVGRQALVCIKYDTFDGSISKYGKFCYVVQRRLIMGLYQRQSDKSIFVKTRDAYNKYLYDLNVDPYNRLQFKMNQTEYLEELSTRFSSAWWRPADIAPRTRERTIDAFIALDDDDFLNGNTLSKSLRKAFRIFPVEDRPKSADHMYRKILTKAQALDLLQHMLQDFYQIPVQREEILS